MVNRIQEIIKRYDLTPSRFADQLEVPRSTISHILSERNKPSLEFLQKILDNYPDININWLIRGEGSIFKHSPDLFSGENTKESAPAASPQQEATLFPAENNKESTQMHDKDKYENLSGEKKKESVGVSAGDEELIYGINRKREEKKVAKIIVLYHDNTFDTYYPSKE